MTQIVDLSPELSVAILNPNQLPQMWEDRRPLLEEAGEWSAGESTPQTVVHGVLGGSYQLVAFMRGHVPESVLVITMSEFGTGKRILEVLLASGSGLKNWMQHEEKMIEYAKHHGCASIRMIGREGLQRMLKGWERTAVVLEREVK